MRTGPMCLDERTDKAGNVVATCRYNLLHDAWHHDPHTGAVWRQS